MEKIKPLIDPALLFWPAVIAACVSGFIAILSLVVNLLVQTRQFNRRIEADSEIIDKKISAEIGIAMKKIDSEQEKFLSEKAWADYEIRRDIYLEIASKIDPLFNIDDHEGRHELERTMRKARLIASDQVVKRLNIMLEALSSKETGSALHKKYSDFFIEMRRDIRMYYSLPPQGTELDFYDYPVDT